MSVEITFRTLKGTSFKLTAQPDDTVLDLKKKVAQHQNQPENPSYRLIYQGKVLSNDATVTSASITSKGFVVVMPVKKATTQISSDASASSQPNKPVEEEKKSDDIEKESPIQETGNEKKDQSNNDNSNTQPTTTNPQNVPDDPNTLVTGDAYDSTVKRLSELGFPEDQVKRALRAAYNSPARAAEFLFEGIPEDSAPPPWQSSSRPSSNTNTNTGNTSSRSTGTTPATTNTPRTSNNNNNQPRQEPLPGTPFDMFAGPPQRNSNAGIPEMADAAQGSLDFLRTIPQFNAMRRIIQSNPNAIPHILQQLETINPALMAMIDANQDEFRRLINEPLRPGEEGGDELAAMAGAAGAEGSNQPAPGQIVVTEEEHQQIVRLTEFAQSMGLEQQLVVETWLSCDRNETLAANYLVDHADELRTDQDDSNAEPGEANQQGNDPDSTPGSGGPTS